MVASATSCSAPPKGEHTDEGGARWAALAGVPSTTPEEAARNAESNVLRTVFVIAMENHDWSSIAGNPAAPYINGTLLRLGAHAERYVSPVHPSEPNYVWLEAGDRLGIFDNDDPTINYRTTRAQLSAQLDTARIPWRSYQEDVSGDTCPFVSQGRYAAKHDPMVFFEDVTEGRNPKSARCIERIRPYAELAGDLASGDVPRYVFITPNLCNDMHDAVGCASPDPIANGDAWLSREVPKILASKAYENGGALFVVWDESGSDGDPPIGLIALSRHAKPGYAGTVPYDHSSLLRTLQDVFGVRPYIRGATDASSLSDLFVTYP